MHFGLYLKNKGVITAEQFCTALEAQLSHFVPIGQLALEEGLLSVRDIFRVLRLQSDLPQERFGVMAIELGLMSEGQLAELLMIQSDRKQPLSEILVRQGVLSEAQTQSELSTFRREQERDGGRTKKSTVQVLRKPAGIRSQAPSVAVTV